MSLSLLKIIDAISKLNAFTINIKDMDDDTSILLAQKIDLITQEMFDEDDLTSNLYNNILITVDKFKNIKSKEDAMQAISELKDQLKNYQLLFDKLIKSVDTVIVEINDVKDVTETCLHRAYRSGIYLVKTIINEDKDLIDYTIKLWHEPEANKIAQIYKFGKGFAIKSSDTIINEAAAFNQFLNSVVNSDEHDLDNFAKNIINTNTSIGINTELSLIIDEL